MKAVYKKELKAYFQSIIGCVFIAFLIAFTGIYFMAYNMTTGYPYFSYTLSGSLIVFIVGIPLITMRSFAEERKNKTDQILNKRYQSPYSPSPFFQHSFKKWRLFFFILKENGFVFLHINNHLLNIFFRAAELLNAILCRKPAAIQYMASSNT